MRVAFAGTPDFAVPCLQMLLARREVKVVAVYTQPDRFAGRGRKLKQSPIKTEALASGLAVYQPTSFDDARPLDRFRSQRIDLMVVVAYGQLLPRPILETPARGCVNVHASLLPRWRGAAPIQRAIEAGDRTTGVTLMQMDAGLDTGPILASTETDILPGETGGTLLHRLSLLGAKLLDQNLSALIEGTLKTVPQNGEQACQASKLTKKESPINWQTPAIQIERKIRAFNPWPTATATLNGIRFRVHRAKTIMHDRSACPGEIVKANRAGLTVQTGQGLLCLQILQKAGGRPMSVETLLNGMDISEGMAFDLDG